MQCEMCDCLLTQSDGQYVHGSPWSATIHQLQPLAQAVSSALLLKPASSALLLKPAHSCSFPSCCDAGVCYCGAMLLHKAALSCSSPSALPQRDPSPLQHRARSAYHLVVEGKSRPTVAVWVVRVVLSITSKLLCCNMPYCCSSGYRPQNRLQNRLPHLAFFLSRAPETCRRCPDSSSCKCCTVTALKPADTSEPLPGVALLSLLLLQLHLPTHICAVSP